MNELEILREKLQIDETAGRIFKVPAILIALFGRDRSTHLDDIGGNGSGVALAAQRAMDHRFDPFGKSGGSRNDARARQGHMLPRPGFFLVVVIEGFKRRRERPGPTGGTQPHVHVVEPAVVGLGGQCID